VFGASHDRLQLGRDERMVQLEFELPATHESIWALAEIRHDRVGTPRGERTMVHGTGMQFRAMARKHERLIADFVFEERRRGLARLLDRITNRRRRDRRRTDRRSVAA
jgi:c-di-GMP-binding flagellar brake protein YcgR